MSKNAYIIVKDTKIKVSEVVNDTPGAFKGISTIKGEQLTSILQKICEKIIQNKVHLLEGEGIQILGDGTAGNPYCIKLVNTGAGEEIVATSGKLLGRFSPVDGPPQAISLGDGLILNSTTGILSVQFPDVSLAGYMEKSVYDTNNNGKVDTSENSDKLSGKTESQLTINGGYF